MNDGSAQTVGRGILSGIVQGNVEPDIQVRKQPQVAAEVVGIAAMTDTALAGEYDCPTIRGSWSSLIQSVSFDMSK